MMQSAKNVTQKPDRYWYFPAWQREIFLSWYYEITFRGAAMLALPRIRGYVLGRLRCYGMRHGANSVVAGRARQYGVLCKVHARQIAKAIPNDVRQAIAAGTRFAESLIRSSSRMAMGGVLTGTAFPELKIYYAGLRVSDTGVSGE